MSDGAATDKWRHLREVVSGRTPDSALAVNRHGARVVAAVGGKPRDTLALHITRSDDRAQADRDLDALSILWNCADELLADLARLREALKRIAESDDNGIPHASGGMHALSWPAILRGVRQIADAALAADRPSEGSAPGDAGRIRRLSEATIAFNEERDYDKRD